MTVAPPRPLVVQPTRAPDPRPVSWLACLIGAVTLLGGSTALGAILEGTTWWWPTVQVVLVVVGIGIGARLIRLPIWATALAQVATLVLTLTALFTTAGWGRVIPNGASIEQATTLLSAAWEQILGTVPPAPATTELSFVIAGAVGIAAVIVDLLIAEARTPALVALPLLCLYSIPASIAPQSLPWYTFVIPAAGYALLLAVAGHGNRRIGLRSGISVSASTVTIAGLAVVGALFIGAAATVIGTEGRLPRNPATAGQVGLSPFTDLTGDLRRAEARPLLAVQGLAAPEYLRTVALTEWVPNQGWAVGDLGEDELPPPAIGTAVTVRSLAFRDRFLPTYPGTSQLEGLGVSWQYDAALQTWHRPDPTDPGTYQIVADLDRPTVAELQADTVTAGGTLTETGQLPADVLRYAEEATRDAVTAFDKASALQEWFTDPGNGFVYSLSVPTGNTGDRLLDFLQQRQGYCEQYASAMAIMLRSLDIPARVAIGFTQGTADGQGGWVISSHDAHAWVEVQFDNAGWVRFDPTPLVNGQGGQQGFASAAPSAPPSSSAVPTDGSTEASPSAPNSLPGRAADLPEEDQPGANVPTAAPQTTGTDESSAPWLPWVLWGLLVAAVLALVLAGPRWIRATRRRRRLAAAAAGGPDAAVQAWAEIEDLAVDHGIGMNAAESTRVAANRLARRIHLGDAGRGRLRTVVTRAEESWYGGESAVAVLEKDDLVAAVEDVRLGLQQQVKPGPVDRWWPPSLRR